MPIELKPEMDGKVLEVHLSGKVHKEDYTHFVPAVEKAIQEHGKLRLLVQMRDFHGWGVGALWEDIKFDAKHFRDFERIAMVGDKKWEKGMAIFCKPFTTAKLRYFPAGQVGEAKAWLAGE